ncbi:MULTISPECIES: TetR/AcrR family transcriptional regulator [Shewanella]|uniref:TetR/AcrR family transcriptional regulator n=1 Tax=Shewanella TaxID=22 RepID=UPI000646B73C|nr:MULTISPECIES: TetR family transcriptional regulator [Shewanella]MCH7422559.1 TetR/AcrR family transcriptional regulator [Shewanella sp. MM_2022_3]MCT8868252.1 TetR/AcrR family transcriptional regulator [Shewanella xiamenensis]NSM24572.1 TetR family transcriptional regulator [Shewanella sp. ZOR0012]
MKVTKAQAQENRERIVRTASVLFRERGYDGVGIAELMSTAGFTHGGFYKHFQSKADLMAEAAAYSFAQSNSQMSDFDIVSFVQKYLSREHRDAPGNGCTMAALCADAGRHSEPLKETFLTGIENQLTSLSNGSESTTEERKAKINAIAHAVGALVLSRSCPDDSLLADEILDVCREEIITNLEAK